MNSNLPACFEVAGTRLRAGTTEAVLRRESYRVHHSVVIKSTLDLSANSENWCELVCQGNPGRLVGCFQRVQYVKLHTHWGAAVIHTDHHVGYAVGGDFDNQP